MNWLRTTADLISKRAVAYDIQQSDAAWASWLCDGPCKSLGRHHRLSRVASGWVPSPISNGEPDEDSLNDAPGDDCISQRELDACDACCSPCPLSLQAEVDAVGSLPRGLAELEILEVLVSHIDTWHRGGCSDCKQHPGPTR